MNSGSINKRLVFAISAVAATGGLLFGFDTGVISGALLFLRKEFSLDAQAEEWVVNCAGSLQSRYISDWPIQA